MLCSQSGLVLLGLDRAARGVWEMEISALGNTSPGAVSSPHSLQKRRLCCAGCPFVSSQRLLNLLTTSIPNPKVHAEPRRTRQVYRQEKLQLLLLNPLPTGWERQDLPTTTAPDIRESTPKHHTAVPTPQILLPGERPDKSSPVPGEEDVCPRITAPKPRIRSCCKVASPRLENSWIHHQRDQTL